MVVRGGTCERKPFGKLAGRDAPILLFVPRKVGLDNGGSILGVAGYGYPAKQDGEQDRFHKQFYSKTTGNRLSVQNGRLFFRFHP